MKNTIKVILSNSLTHLKVILYPINLFITAMIICPPSKPGKGRRLMIPIEMLIIQKVYRNTKKLELMDCKIILPMPIGPVNASNGTLPIKIEEKTVN